MRPEYRFLLACLANACALIAAVVLAAPPILRMVIALPLVFVLPGEAALRALDLRFVPIARTSIVVGLSMAMTLAGGFILDCFGGLTPIGWVIWLGAATLLPAALARRGGTRVRLTLPGIKIRHALMLAATCAVFVLTFLRTIHSTQSYHPFHYTDFWMVPQIEGTDAYAIGIKNGEGRTKIYNVRLMVDQRIEGQWQHIVLAPEQSLILPISVPRGAPAEAWLFRAEQPDSVYRSVNVANKEAMGAVIPNAVGGGG